MLDNIKIMNFTDDEKLSCSATKGDLLVCEGGAGYGRSAIWNKDYDICLQNHIHRLRPCVAGICEYIYHYIYLLKESNSLASVGTAMPGLSANRLKGILVSLPSLAEQKRIVSKLKEIFPQIEQYSHAQDKLDELNLSINASLKKSILQEAIQGKLVRQITEEGTGQELLEQIQDEKKRLVKAGKLKKSALSDSHIYKGDDNSYYERIGQNVKCIDDEIPFEIPESWSWCRLESLCIYIQRGKSPKYSLIRKYPVIAQKCNQWSGFSIEKAQFITPESMSSYGEERMLQDGDLMWNSTGLGTLGRMAIYYSQFNPYKLAVADSHVTVIRLIREFSLPEYLYSYISNPTVQIVIEDKADGSTKQKELSTSTIKKYLIPLPPLSEQKRIVKRIDKSFQILH